LPTQTLEVRDDQFSQYHESGRRRLLGNPQEGLMPLQPEKSIVSINEPYRKAARKTLGNLTKTPTSQLIDLYYACERAEEDWQNALDHTVGRNERTAERVAAHELDRIFYMQEIIVAEMRKRSPDDRYEVERVRAMLSWFDKSGQTTRISMRRCSSQ
jgi:hypothetical protein